MISSPTFSETNEYRTATATATATTGIEADEPSTKNNIQSTAAILHDSVSQQQDLVQTYLMLAEDDFSSSFNKPNEIATDHQNNNNNNSANDAFTTSTAASSQTSFENNSLRRQQFVRTISELFEDSVSDFDNRWTNNNHNASAATASSMMPPTTTTTTTTTTAAARNNNSSNNTSLMLLEENSQRSKRSERSLFSRQQSGRSLMSLSQIFEDESETMEIFLQSKDSLLSRDSSNLLPPRKTSFLSQVIIATTQDEASFISHNNTSLSTRSDDEMNLSSSLSDFLSNKNRPLTDAEMAALRTEVKRLAELKQHDGGGGGSIAAFLAKQRKQQQKEHASSIGSGSGGSGGSNNFIPRDLLRQQTSSSRRMIKRRRPRQQQQQQQQSLLQSSRSYTDDSDKSRSVQEDNSQVNINNDGTVTEPLNQSNYPYFLDEIQETASAASASEKSEGKVSATSSSHGSNKGSSNSGSSSGHTEPSLALSHLFEGVISETDNDESGSTGCYGSNDNSSSSISSSSKQSGAGSHCCNSSCNNNSKSGDDEPSYVGNISLPSNSSSADETLRYADSSSRISSVDSSINDEIAKTANNKDEEEQRQRELELLAAPMLGNCSSHTANQTIRTGVSSKSSTLDGHHDPKASFASPQRRIHSSSIPVNESPSASRRHRSIAALELSEFASQNETQSPAFSPRQHSCGSLNVCVEDLSPLHTTSPKKSARHRSVSAHKAHHFSPVRSERKRFIPKIYLEDEVSPLSSSVGSTGRRSNAHYESEDDEEHQIRPTTKSKRGTMKSFLSGTSTYGSSVDNSTEKRASRGTKTTKSSSKSSATRGADRSAVFKSDILLNAIGPEKLVQKEAKHMGRKASRKPSNFSQAGYKSRTSNVAELSFGSSVQDDAMKKQIGNREARHKKIQKDIAPRKPSNRRQKKKKEPVRGTARTISVSSITLGDTSSVVSGLDCSFVDETSMDSSIDSKATGSRY